MAMRILAGFGGFAVVLIGAWYNITMSEAASLFAPAAAIYLVCALGSGIGGPIVGSAFHRGHAIIGAGLLLFILAGEGYGIITTMDRTVRAEDAAQKPLIQATERHAAALKRLDEANDAVKMLASAEPKSLRLDAAKTALSEANKAVTDQSSAKNCLKNCAAMLTATAQAARRELDLAQSAAENDLRAARQRAADDQSAAERIVKANPLPGSASPLADRIGIEPWKIDIAKAVLLSLAINGLGMGFLAFAFHARSHKPQPTGPDQRNVQRKHPTQNDLIDITPTRAAAASERARTKRLPSPAALQAARFGKDDLKLTADGDIAVRDILKSFTRWVDENREPMPSMEDAAAGFRTVFERLGVRVENGRVRGLAFKSEDRREDAA